MEVLPGEDNKVSARCHKVTRMTAGATIPIFACAPIADGSRELRKSSLFLFSKSGGWMMVRAIAVIMGIRCDGLVPGSNPYIQFII